MVKQISDNEIYLLIKYIKSVLWRAVKRLSYIEEARCLKVNVFVSDVQEIHNTELCVCVSYSTGNFMTFFNVYRPDVFI